MIITLFIRASCNSFKSVKVQLALESRAFGELEVFCENVINDLWFVNDKASSVGLPRHNAAMSIIVYLVKHIVKLEGERDVTGC
mmetsp:Transcript_16049/g.20989  ORF Transcript_16049/g.20989 Transcript_16049/m.20989 type:complete len:84 (-) Transcript_16049:378-629(-)